MSDVHRRRPIQFNKFFLYLVIVCRGHGDFETALITHKVGGRSWEAYGNARVTIIMGKKAFSLAKLGLGLGKAPYRYSCGLSIMFSLNMCRWYTAVKAAIRGPLALGAVQPKV